MIEIFALGNITMNAKQEYCHRMRSVLKAKGPNTVLMDREEYQKKLNRLMELNNPQTQRIPDGIPMEKI
jgi:hypothetical protein